MFSSAIQSMMGNSSSFAANCGSKSFGRVVLDSLTFSGRAELIGTTVNNLAKVNGMLIANSASLNELEIKGTAEIKNSTVNRDAVIDGVIKAENTAFRGLISANTNESSFVDCSTQNIVVKVPSTDKEQQIILSGTTIVSGSITFEKGSGKVLKSSNSRIDGAVLGGDVVDN